MPLTKLITAAEKLVWLINPLLSIFNERNTLHHRLNDDDSRDSRPRLDMYKGLFHFYKTLLDNTYTEGHDQGPPTPPPPTNVDRYPPFSSFLFWWLVHVSVLRHLINAKQYICKTYTISRYFHLQEIKKKFLLENRLKYSKMLRCIFIICLISRLCRNLGRWLLFVFLKNAALV